MTRAYIQAQRLSYAYLTDEALKIKAVDEISLTVQKGERLAILGRNGSGKSTLAKLLSCLEFAESGELSICHLKPEDEATIWEIRRRCGMVFQNPDNQIIGTTVEEDIAFGPENLGVNAREIRSRIDQIAAQVGLSAFLQRPPSALSGGQKQKLALAGVLALEPDVLILDESTSMLDPLTRREVLALIDQLQQAHQLTVINITHHMDEALLSDRIYVIDQGKILLEGTPQEIFSKPQVIQSLGLDVPIHTAIATAVLEALSMQPQEASSLVHPQHALKTLVDLWRSYAHKALPELRQGDNGQSVLSTIQATIDSFYEMRSQAPQSHNQPLIEVKNLSYTYPSRTDEGAKPALEEISFEIYPGEIFGIMGHTGSGKSTLIRHLNGLIRPQEGSVTVAGQSTAQNAGIRGIRRQVGLLFQYPEHQLFAETVAEDVAYGPTRLGFSEEAVAAAVQWSLNQVGLDQSFCERSPFELSGGQKRRVALAGVLAMKPKVLVLDEPAAALDPAGREEMLTLIEKMRQEGVTVVLVSHSMEDLARICDRILVLEQGRAKCCETPQAVFAQTADALARSGLLKPAPLAFAQAFLDELQAVFYDSQALPAPLVSKAFSIESAKNELLSCFKPFLEPPASQTVPAQDGR